MQRSLYIRFDCDSRLLHGHMLVREDQLNHVLKNLKALCVSWKESGPLAYSKPVPSAFKQP